MSIWTLKMKGFWRKTCQLHRTPNALGITTKLYRDRESQIKAIEDTFDAAKAPIEKHYSKPNVYPIDVLSVYPDFELWKHPCAQVIFDSDPAAKPSGGSALNQNDEMSQAMIRG